MLSVYPYASGSLYIAGYTITASFADNIRFISYTITASNAGTVLYPESGSMGKGICLLTTDQYLLMSSSNKVEKCQFD